MSNPTITHGFDKLAVDTTNPRRRFGRILSDTAAEALGLQVTPGMFVINTGTEDNPWFVFARLTGRTRRQWGMAMPTIDLFQVDPVVLDTVMPDGIVRPSIWGVPGRRMVGTWMTRPENVVWS